MNQNSELYSAAVKVVRPFASAASVRVRRRSVHGTLHKWLQFGGAVARGGDRVATNAGVLKS